MQPPAFSPQPKPNIGPKPALKWRSVHPERTPLLRPERLAKPWGAYGKILTGTAAGTAAHLGLNPNLVRLIFLVSSLFGAGIILYLWLWIFTPAGDPWQAGRAAKHTSTPVGQARLISPLQAPAPTPLVSNSRSQWLKIVVIALVFLAVALVLARIGPEFFEASDRILPLAVAGIGLALTWVNVNTMAEKNSAGAWVAGISGLIIMILGVTWTLAGSNQPFQALRGAGITLLALALVAAALTPLAVRFARKLAASQVQEARQAERADIAAHLHDSVLQTLSLIRVRANNPAEVSRLARAQERELRQWLYEDRSGAGTSLVQAIREEVAALEDLHGLTIDAVTVSDYSHPAELNALVAATREALNNAVRHGRAPISLYCEAGKEGVEVFVRDHGDGFDLAQIPADRHGVRDSIIARLQRRGGSAQIVARDPGVELRLYQPYPRPETEENRGAETSG